MTKVKSYYRNEKKEEKEEKKETKKPMTIGERIAFSIRLTVTAVLFLLFALSWGNIVWQLQDYEMPKLFAGERLIYVREEVEEETLEAIAARAKAHLDGYHAELKKMEAKEAELAEVKSEMLQGFLSFE